MKQMGSIELLANYDDWKCIKKFRVKEETDPKTLMEFAVSYAISLDKKFEEYLHEAVDMSQINAIVNVDKKMPLPSLMELVQSNETKQAIRSAAKGSKELERYLEAYVARKALKERGLSVEFNQVEIPGLKRLLKKKG